MDKHNLIEAVTNPGTSRIAQAVLSEEKDPYAGSSCPELSEAIMKSFDIPETIKEFIGKHPEFNYSDVRVNGTSILYSAYNNRMASAVWDLLGAGADPNVVANPNYDDDWSVFDKAALKVDSQQSVDLLEAMVAAGASSDRWPDIIVYCIKSELDIELIRRMYELMPFNPNTDDNYLGYTAFGHLNADAVEWLVDINFKFKKNKSGHYPWEYTGDLSTSDDRGKIAMFKDDLNDLGLQDLAAKINTNPKRGKRIDRRDVTRLIERKLI